MSALLMGMLYIFLSPAWQISFESLFHATPSIFKIQEAEFH